MKITCPDCKTEHEFELTAKAAGDNLVSLRVCPLPGQLLSPLVVGGMMRSFERLFEACMGEGYRTNVGIQKLETEADGCIRMDALIMRIVEKDAPEIKP